MSKEIIQIPEREIIEYDRYIYPYEDDEDYSYILRVRKGSNKDIDYQQIARSTIEYLNSNQDLNSTISRLISTNNLYGLNILTDYWNSEIFSYSTLIRNNDKPNTLIHIVNLDSFNPNVEQHVLLEILDELDKNETTYIYLKDNQSKELKDFYLSCGFEVAKEITSEDGTKRTVLSYCKQKLLDKKVAETPQSEISIISHAEYKNDRSLLEMSQSVMLSKSKFYEIVSSLPEEERISFERELLKILINDQPPEILNQFNFQEISPILYRNFLIDVLSSYKHFKSIEDVKDYTNMILKFHKEIKNTCSIKDISRYLNSIQDIDLVKKILEPENGNFDISINLLELLYLAVPEEINENLISNVTIYLEKLNETKIYDPNSIPAVYRITAIEPLYSLLKQKKLDKDSEVFGKLVELYTSDYLFINFGGSLLNHKPFIEGSRKEKTEEAVIERIDTVLKFLNKFALDKKNQSEEQKETDEKIIYEFLEVLLKIQSPIKLSIDEYKPLFEEQGHFRKANKGAFNVDYHFLKLVRNEKDLIYFFENYSYISTLKFIPISYEAVVNTQLTLQNYCEISKYNSFDLFRNYVDENKILSKLNFIPTLVEKGFEPELALLIATFYDQEEIKKLELDKIENIVLYIIEKQKSILSTSQNKIPAVTLLASLEFWDTFLELNFPKIKKDLKKGVLDIVLDLLDKNQNINIELNSNNPELLKNIFEDKPFSDNVIIFGLLKEIPSVLWERILTNYNFPKDNEIIFKDLLLLHEIKNKVTNLSLIKEIYLSNGAEILLKTSEDLIKSGVELNAANLLKAVFSKKLEANDYFPFYLLLSQKSFLETDFDYTFIESIIKRNPNLTAGLIYTITSRNLVNSIHQNRTLDEHIIELIKQSKVSLENQKEILKIIFSKNLSQSFAFYEKYFKYFLLEFFNKEALEGTILYFFHDIQKINSRELRNKCLNFCYEYLQEYSGLFTNDNQNMDSFLSFDEIDKYSKIPAELKLFLYIRSIKYPNDIKYQAGHDVQELFESIYKLNPSYSQKQRLLNYIIVAPNNYNNSRTLFDVIEKKLLTKCKDFTSEDLETVLRIFQFSSIIYPISSDYDTDLALMADDITRNNYEIEEIEQLLNSFIEEKLKLIFTDGISINAFNFFSQIYQMPEVLMTYSSSAEHDSFYLEQIINSLDDGLEGWKKFKYRGLESDFFEKLTAEQQTAWKNNFSRLNRDVKILEYSDKPQKIFNAISNFFKGRIPYRLVNKDRVEGFKFLVEFFENSPDFNSDDFEIYSNQKLNEILFKIKEIEKDLAKIELILDYKHFISYLEFNVQKYQRGYYIKVNTLEHDFKILSRYLSDEMKQILKEKIKLAENSGKKYVLAEEILTQDLYETLINELEKNKNKLPSSFEEIVKSNNLNPSSEDFIEKLRELRLPFLEKKKHLMMPYYLIKLCQITPELVFDDKVSKDRAENLRGVIGKINDYFGIKNIKESVIPKELLFVPQDKKTSNLIFITTDSPLLSFLCGTYPSGSQSCQEYSSGSYRRNLLAYVGDSHTKVTYALDLKKLSPETIEILNNYAIDSIDFALIEKEILNAIVARSILKLGKNDKEEFTVVIEPVYTNMSKTNHTYDDLFTSYIRNYFEPFGFKISTSKGNKNSTITIPASDNIHGQYEDSDLVMQNFSIAQELYGEYQIYGSILT